jgi:hypothetical protein
MSVTPSPIGGFAAQFFDNNGVILSGGKIYTYAAGTTTPQASYTSAAGTTPHANPIILDSAGRVPGGEIWLTDGLVYKFVIETATGSLLGTYDNITGVNSNFVNYTIQEEVQTATAGQTVFNLSTINYTPGTNSLTVYIDGVNQYVGDSYLETDSNTVTFTSGVHVGGEVKFTTAIQTTTGAVDASIVAYDPPFTNSVATNVEAKLAQYISVMDFGAVGDGVADDAAAVQDAIDYVQTLGGNLYFPKGVYLFGSQVTIDRTYAPSGGNFVGERNLIISGYGAEIRTTGAISAFDVKGGWLPNHNCLIEGFTIYHRGNTTAVAGIRMIGAGLVTCREVSVAVSSSLPAGYAAFSMENSDPTDVDTGCFWNVIEQCSVRPWAGAEGFCDYGVKLMGSSNATTLRCNTFSGSNTHVILMAHPGQAFMPNSVNIDGNFFEGPITSTAISLVSSSTPYHVTGTRITNNRFESLNIAVSLTGTGTTVQLPTYMSANYADTSVTTYIVNASNIPLVMLDFVEVGAPMGPAKTYNQEGVVIENSNSSFNPLTLKSPNLNRGLEIQTAAGSVLGGLKYSNAAGGNGLQLAGSYSPNYRPLTIKGCQGIAARDTSANNLAGTSAFSAATTKTVNLPLAETDANYLIFLMPQADQKLWISARTATDFTVQSDVSSSNSFGWLLIRHL